VRLPCTACKGKRYNADTLKVTWKGRTIAEILDVPIEEGAEFFADERAIGPKMAILDNLGLGYLTLGQSATTLSGGEVLVTGTPAQVAKCRSSHAG
jgi:excinuclease ABC subunit A|tara:strand:- start:690 stop:977 length:288 start_codon:yes stop_codon:yes gene_type:complete